MTKNTACVQIEGRVAARLSAGVSANSFNLTNAAVGALSDLNSNGARESFINITLGTHNAINNQEQAPT
jgi:hypothetical protein